MGWEVVALCDPRREAAEEKRDEYFPAADVCHTYVRAVEIPVEDIFTVGNLNAFGYLNRVINRNTGIVGFPTLHGDGSGIWHTSHVQAISNYRCIY